MPRRRSLHSLSKFRALWRLFQDVGEKPVGATFFMDGSVKVITVDYAKAAREEAADLETNEWDAVLPDGKT